MTGGLKGETAGLCSVSHADVGGRYSEGTQKGYE